MQIINGTAIINNFITYIFLQFILHIKYSTFQILYQYLMTQNQFKGKVCIITASSTGIGLAIAQRMAMEGAKVIISSRNKGHIQNAVTQIKKNGGDAYGIVCHVGNKADRTKLINQTLDHYGNIDFLVTNAAVSTHVGNFLQAQQSKIQKMWDINYKSTFFLIQQALPHLRKSKSSGIVIISSEAGCKPKFIVDYLPRLLGHYAITKAALLAMNKILANELLQDGIRVNCIAPGIIKTKFSQMFWEGKEKQTIQNLGVARLGEVEDIANAVRFLLSKQSSYMTGQTLFIAGKPSPRL